jgi:hypothetical protein
MRSRCWLDPRVQLGPSAIHGTGLFATSAIAAGELVGILGGRSITDMELRQITHERERYSSAAIAEGVNVLMGDDEPLARGNHSCDSNLWMRDALAIEARRDIAAGEELTVDYALQTVVEWEMPCRCGSSSCRGTVRGSDWMRPDVRLRYRGHFSPFINERIAASGDD